MTQPYRHKTPGAPKLNIIIVSKPKALIRARDDIAEFNIARFGAANVKHVTYGEALTGYRADIIIISMKPMYGLVAFMPASEIEYNARQSWLKDYLRLRLAPGGLWIENF
jgi:hypothetical protein